MTQLQQAKGDLLLALHVLQQQLVQGSSSTPHAPVTYATVAAAAADVLPEEWVGEVEVLGAIYGEQLDASTPGMVTLAVEGGEQVGRRLRESFL
jgi:hypothetical protein